MLVLSRKAGEKLYVGKDITVTVIELKGNRVKIGIEAPSSCPIIRSELTPYDRSSRQLEPAGIETESPRL